MNRLPATMAGQQAVAYVDPGAIAAAESVKARIQASFIMALQRPRDEFQSRARILEACKRPEFAQRVEYSKPVGGKPITGPSIRFAELAVREWGNVLTETQIVFEDDYVRRIKVTIIDLETNATFGKEMQITKTVERSSDKGREVISSRKNSYNKDVFIVVATDEEMATKEAAIVSKIIRNEGLRLIPQDIVDEGIATARKTLLDRDAKDPKAALKGVMDAFATLNISPKNLAEYIGHGLETISPVEIQDLRGVYQAIHSGESTWADYCQPKRGASDDLNEILDAKPVPTVKESMTVDQPSESVPTDPQPEAKRPTAAEREQRRNMLLQRIESEGLDLEVAEAAVNAFARDWTTAKMDKVEFEIIPNMLAEAAGV